MRERAKAMPEFTYEARDGEGRMRDGREEAASATAMAALLRERGWLVLDMREAPPIARRGGRTPFAAWLPTAWWPVSMEEVEGVLRQLAVMLRSGLTLLGALQAARENAEGSRMRGVLGSVMTRIEGGGTFADALRREGVFGDLTVQLARVGEETGNLDAVLERAADAIERRRQLMQQVLTALAYPLLVLVAAVGVAGFMVIEVIPRLEGLMKSLGRKLPPTTLALIEVSAWARADGPWWLAGLVVLGAMGGVAIRMPGGRLLVDRWLLALPLLGEVLRVAGSAMFARALSILLRSGVTVLDGLRTAEALAGNRHLAWVVARARERVLGGGTLSGGLGAKGGFVPMLGRMVAVGEATGRMEEVLEEVARHLEAQLTVRVRRLSAMVEPAIIVAVGGIVGFVYVTFFLTLYAAAGTTR